MADPRVVEAVTGLRDDLHSRLLFSALAEDLAELCAILSLLGYKELPTELLTRLRALEAELREVSRLCRFPPLPLPLPSRSTSEPRRG